MYTSTRLRVVFFIVCLTFSLQPGYILAQDTDSNKTLKEQLDATNKRFTDSMAPAVVQNINDAVKEVQDSDILANAINEGDKAPDFTLPDASGNEVNLYSLLKKGPVVLTWYRGNW